MARPEIVRWSEPAALARVAAALRADAVVALPTETLYGLSCRAQGSGLARIEALKGIVAPRGFVALAATSDEVERWTRIESRPRRFLRATWPAALTAVLPVPSPLDWGEARDGLDTAAFRVPAHATLRALLAEVGEPVVSTSANRTGQPPLVEVGAIVEAFGPGLDLAVVDDVGPGTRAAGRASTVGDFTVWPPRILRSGEFDLEAAVRSWSDR
jgi:L-threonylcarbamoyladenylate synthase